MGMVTATKYEVIQKSVSDYFSAKEERFRVLRAVCDGSSEVSSRFMEWFVTVYAKAFPVIIFTDMDGKYSEHPTNECRHRVNVHTDFRSCMKIFTKNYFDPFRRKSRVTFFYEGSSRSASTVESVDTTVAQMNYVRWVHRTGIYTYAVRNREAIMQQFYAQHAPHAPMSSHA